MWGPPKNSSTAGECTAMLRNLGCHFFFKRANQDIRSAKFCRVNKTVVDKKIGPRAKFKSTVPKNLSV